MRTKKLNPTPDQLSLPEMKAMIYIERYITILNYPPTVREIAEAIDLSVSVTHDLVNRLIEYGYLGRKYKRRSRRNLVVKRVAYTPPAG